MSAPGDQGHPGDDGVGAPWPGEAGARAHGPGCRVELTRASEPESVHLVDGVVAGAGTEEEIHFGDPHRLTYFRSSFKPFQALPLVSEGAAGRFGVSSEELALCCASHAGTPEHVRRVAGLLDRVGFDEEALACGPQEPFDREEARRLQRDGASYGRLHNNCSGKHAGMLALARHAGWDPDGYEEPDHPVQQRIRRELSAWLDVDPQNLTWGVDGCGVPTPYLSLRQMARAYARLGRASDDGQTAPAAVVNAMTSHPSLVSGPGRLTTRMMEAADGRLLVKDGAEGVLCIAAPREGWGLALKVRDGAGRARGPAAVEMLAAVDLLAEQEVRALEDLRNPPVRNTAGDEVGRVRAEATPHAVYTAHAL